MSACLLSAASLDSKNSTWTAWNMVARLIGLLETTTFHRGSTNLPIRRYRTVETSSTSTETDRPWVMKMGITAG
jgi:hypothetical protein